MNSYQLISKLRKVRADTYLSAIDQALYHELISICNEKGWKDVFEVRSSTLCASLNIWDKTLRKSRKALADTGLISFESSKDKRVGCFYSFSLKLSNDMKTSVISSVNGTDDSSITHYKRIKTINREESLTHTREIPPSKGKSPKKKEMNEKPLEYPYTSIRFMTTWEALRNTPKWKNKLNYALQLSLNKLGKFEEEFAIEQMERAIESNWTGVVFSGTEEKYQEWLNRKNGKTEAQRQNGRDADKAAKARNLIAEYAAIEQGCDAIGHQAEIPDL